CNPVIADINTLLSLVEDIIRQQNRAAGDFYTDASKKDRSMILTFFCLFAWTEDSIRYLYRQLRHVEKELSLLGPTRFPNPNSYSRAMQQEGLWWIWGQTYKTPAGKDLNSHIN
uniref:Uncharacterized protein n=1 Tax=Amphiprion percula TaxID=161767 RepID=A0A3P8SV49_AMPPE